MGRFRFNPRHRLAKVVIGIDHRHSRFAQASEYLSLRPCHTLNSGKALQVGRASVGNHCHLGARDVSQQGDLTRMIGPHFNHTKIMLPPHRQQGHRYTNGVIQVATGRGDTTTAGDNRRDHLFGCGLAVAAGHCDQRQSKSLTPGSSKATQGKACIIHDQLWQGRLTAMVHQCSGSTLFHCRREVTVSVVVGTMERNK